MHRCRPCSTPKAIILSMRSASIFSTPLDAGTCPTTHLSSLARTWMGGSACFQSGITSLICAWGGLLCRRNTYHASEGIYLWDGASGRSFSHSTSACATNSQTQAEHEVMTRGLGRHRTCSINESWEHTNQLGPHDPVWCLNVSIPSPTSAAYGGGQQYRG